MKTIKKTYYIFIAFIAIASNQSCGTSEIKDEQLSSFMLGGIYFIHGYGGIDATKKMISDSNLTTNEEIIDGYKQIFEFPFESSQAVGIKQILSDMWDIENKATLLEQTEILKTREHKYKSWDYARLVNNLVMGYAAGYVTKEEVMAIIIDILPLAREKYATWDDYFKDFNLGREDWSSDDPDKTSFENISKNITQGDDSIYSIITLN